MLDELHHHGYRLSPGTLYPMLARMAKRGWLRAAEPKRSKAARVYPPTPRGHEVLTQILDSLDELYREVGEHHAAPSSIDCSAAQKNVARDQTTPPTPIFAVTRTSRSWQLSSLFYEFRRRFA
jgi:DNA-binding PadR family transcriptional regulator